MIQFNLLPDVKLEYIKTKRTKHLVLVAAMAVSGASLTILVILFMAVSVYQKDRISDLSKDIKTNIADLKKIPNLEKILTVQNQLGALGGLHAKKPQVSRLYNYINQVTPINVTISSATIKLDNKTLTISGNSADLSTVNKFVDTLKFVNYTTADSPATKKNPFSSVVLSSFSLIPTAPTDKKASYSITMIFDPAIFDNTKEVLLDVPKQITTRSETEKPTLFQVDPTLNTSPGGR
ncbi:MAG: hypothetical protein WCK69_00955 [Candidatus Saccharibacteria bacterium]